jgi:MAF protein
MDMLGIPFETCPSEIDERAVRDEDPRRLTLRLAEAKAEKVRNRYPDGVIVAGDAVVARDGRTYEKPRDLDEAARFLRELSSNQFQFVTSLVVLHSRTGKVLSTVETSDITFRDLSEREIQAYIRQYDVLRYAGAFESDAVLKFAERISGSYNFVTALPVTKLIVFLREQGVAV